MHINLNTFESGPCGHVSSGRDPETGEVGVPALDGGTTTNIVEAARCVQWLGPNQPGITEPSGLPPYDPAVCPNGTEPEAALELCNPGGRSQRTPARGSDGDGGQGAAEAGGAPSAPAPAGGGNVPDEVLDQILDLPNNALEDLGGTLDQTLDGLGGGGQSSGGGGGGLGGTANAAEDLLDFLFGS
jgi:hypothetical protein